ncbi:MAG: AAA family ATPase [Spirochaetales bacterium]|nr:AAA family ATPase [Spirochaetales bacterium]
MILKSIELFGFKSFADRTKIEIRDGISAIIGPNGCGKSNILDAIKWVLGEQSTRNLRAEKMEDVIFAGTEQRKALNVAEVSLMLCNDDNLFPVEMSEIQVKRRIYRNAESEYFINNAPAKLKDVRELFFDTGIGKTAYSIMEQGKIDAILSNKPEDRRFIFEEAAGITGYKMKNQEAEKKLERTEENIGQIESILGEIKRSYETLRSQSEKTVAYRTLNEKLFGLELDSQLLKLKSFLEEQEKRERELSGQSSSRDVIKSDIDEINNLLEKNIDMVNTMESHLIEIQKKLYGIDIEKNNFAAQIQILKERISELDRKVQYDEARTKGIREKMARLEQERKGKESSIEGLRREIGGIEGNIAGFEHDVDLALVRIRENDAGARRLGEENGRLEEGVEVEREALRAVTDDIVTELDRRLSETGYSTQERKTLEERIEGALASLRLHTDGKRSLVADARAVGELPARGLDLVAEYVGEVDAGLTELAELFGRYRKTSASFLDEFVAPEGIITRKRAIDERISLALKRIAANRQASDALKEESAALGRKIDEYKTTLGELRVNLATMRTKIAVQEEDRGRLAGEIGDLRKQDEENEREIIQTKKSAADIQGSIDEIEEKRTSAEEEERALKGSMAKLEKEIQEKNQFLLSKERALKEKVEALEKAQSKVEKIQMILAEINAEIRNTNDNFRDRYSRDLADYKARMFEIGLPPQKIKEEYAAVKDEIAKLGSVNLMAVEEFAEVRERYEFLTAQLDDLKRAKIDLIEITKKIQGESTRRFEETYAQVKKNFHSSFRVLFGGGRAELKLVDPDSVLESGIDILAQPPGKKLEHISLLSGGERSLVAIALLFAVYRVKPSPFCVLDEIDAALDDKNIGQFIGMLAEFADKSQFLIISHNKKTVTSATSLLGVTMEESGVSKLVTIKLKNQEDAKVHA